MSTEKRKNPWLGLGAYEEGDTIYGRTEEIASLSQCILSSAQTVVYGRSGIGKTSILNAGVFPVVRKNGVFPVSVRLHHNDRSSYVRQIAGAIETEIGRLRKNGYDDEGEVTVTYEAGSIVERVKKIPRKEDESLWEYFHRHEFLDAAGRRIRPLVLLDQFEEIFTLEKDRDKVRRFFSELADLLNGVIPDYVSDATDDYSGREAVVAGPSGNGLVMVDLNVPDDRIEDYLTDQNFHLVITLREDFLSYLERETTGIPPLRRNRYCLQPINEEQAAVIIMNPIKGLVERDVAKLIIEKVTRETAFKLDGIPELQVDSSVLSLYLNRLYDRLADGETSISADLVESESDNIISDFYLESISDIPQEAVEFLEDSLVKDGRRDNILKSQAVRRGHMSEQLLQKLIDRMILRQFDYDGRLRIEFIHDVLCPVVMKRIEQRKMQEEQRAIELRHQQEEQALAEERKRVMETKARNKRVTTFLAAVAVGLIAVLAVIVSLGIRNRRQSRELGQLDGEVQALLPAVIEQSIRNGNTTKAGQLMLRLYQDSLYRRNDPVNVSLLRAFSTSSAMVLEGHFMSVNSASFSQDGELAFTGSDDRTVRIWDARLGIPLSTVSDLKSGVACLAVSPDGKRLVVGTKDGEIATYAVSGDNPAREQGRGLGNTYARFVTFNPDGSEVVVCCLDGSVLFLNAQDLAEKDRFSISPGGATYVSFDRTGRRMAVAGSDHLITVRDAATKEMKTTYSGHKDWVRSVVFSPDGSKLLSCSDDKSLRLWDVESNACIVLDQIKDYWFTKAAFTPDGKRVVSSARDGYLRVYDVDAGREITELRRSSSGALNDFSLSPDGTHVITCTTDPEVHIWDTGGLLEGKASFREKDAIHGIAFLPGAKRIAAVTESGLLHVWDVEADSSRILSDPGRGGCIDVSPDGRTVAVSSRGQVLLLDSRSGADIGLDNAGGHAGWVRCLRFSPDGSSLVSVGSDGKVVVWDLQRKALARAWKGSSKEVYSVAFRHDGKVIATGDMDGFVRQWEVASGSPVGDSLRVHTKVVMSLCYNCDDSSILSSSGDQTACLTRTDGTVLQRFVGASGFMYSAIFGLTEEEIITGSGDSSIRIWCVANGKENAKLVGSFASVTQLLLREDGMLFSSDNAGEIRQWSIPTLPSVADTIRSRYSGVPLTEVLQF